jgi:hypothetical protein
MRVAGGGCRHCKSTDMELRRQRGSVTEISSWNEVEASRTYSYCFSVADRKYATCREEVSNMRGPFRSCLPKEASRRRTARQASRDLELGPQNTLDKHKDTSLFGSMNGTKWALRNSPPRRIASNVAIGPYRGVCSCSSVATRVMPRGAFPLCDLMHRVVQPDFQYNGGPQSTVYCKKMSLGRPPTPSWLDRLRRSDLAKVSNSSR